MTHLLLPGSLDVIFRYLPNLVLSDVRVTEDLLHLFVLEHETCMFSRENDQSALVGQERKELLDKIDR